MKKFGKILVAAICAVTATVLVIAFAACGGGAKTYTKTLNDLTKDSTPEGIFTEAGKGYAIGYAGSFGSFVDSVSCEATLVVDGDTYTFTWQVHCGTSACATGTWDPEFIWTGDVTASTDTSVTLSAPKTGQITINSTKQFATNAEMTGYFGVSGYVATNETTDCPYGDVPYGATLLTLIQAGTYTVDGSSLGSFTAA